MKDQAKINQALGFDTSQLEGIEFVLERTELQNSLIEFVEKNPEMENCMMITKLGNNFRMFADFNSIDELIILQKRFNQFVDKHINEQS